MLPAPTEAYRLFWNNWSLIYLEHASFSFQPPVSATNIYIHIRATLDWNVALCNRRQWTHKPGQGPKSWQKLENYLNTNLIFFPQNNHVMISLRKNMATNTNEFSALVVFTTLLFNHFIHHHEGKMLWGKSPSIYSGNYATQTDGVPLVAKRSYMFISNRCLRHDSQLGTLKILSVTSCLWLLVAANPSWVWIIFLKWILASVAR